jgi:hypothetical protein
MRQYIDDTCYDLDPASFGQLFGSAADLMPYEKVIEIFEQDESDLLILRTNFAHALFSEKPFLYTLEDLTSITASYIAHLEKPDNKAHILETGYPLRSFPLCPWLDHTLSNLYPSKMPFRVIATPESDGSLSYKYQWTQESFPIDAKFLKTEFENGGYELVVEETIWPFPPRIVDYKEACNFRYLTWMVADGIPQQRSRLFKIKILVLNEILSELRSDMSLSLAPEVTTKEILDVWHWTAEWTDEYIENIYLSRLFSQYRRIFFKHLTFDDILFYMGLVEIYRHQTHNSGALSPTPNYPPIDCQPGGWYDIANALCFYWQGMDMRSMEIFLHSLEEIGYPFDNNCKSGESCYFELVAKFGLDKVNTILDEFDFYRRDPLEMRDTHGYGAKGITDWVCGFVDASISVSTRVKPEHYIEVKRNFEGAARAQEFQTLGGGDPLALSIKQTRESGVVEAFVHSDDFRRIKWYDPDGVQHSATLNIRQAQAIKILHTQQVVKGNDAVAQLTITGDSGRRIRDIFRQALDDSNNPLLENLIEKAKGQGMYRLRLLSQEPHD